MQPPYFHIIYSYSHIIYSENIGVYEASLFEWFSGMLLFLNQISVLIFLLPTTYITALVGYNVLNNQICIYSPYYMVKILWFT